jgi:hypothetical protein
VTRAAVTKQLKKYSPKFDILESTSMRKSFKHTKIVADLPDHGNAGVWRGLIYSSSRQQCRLRGVVLLEGGAIV